MKQDSLHIPVLLQESINGLAIKSGECIVDGTFGGGGHSSAIKKMFGASVSLICVDLDEDAEKRFADCMQPYPDTLFVHANFKDVDRILEQAHRESVSKVLLDLGTSTFQLLEDSRGFSFRSETPLAMTFSHHGAHTGFTAATIVNEWEESSIADIIYGYGEEKRARVIAHAIVAARTQKPIVTALELAQIIERVIPRRGKTHPATKTFQALRIAVNDELAVVSSALSAWWEHLLPGGRIAVITFHSLEDRVVKQWMKQHERVITKKPIVPTRSELLANPRARSAKLRIIEKPL